MLEAVVYFTENVQRRLEIDEAVNENCLFLAAFYIASCSTRGLSAARSA